MRYFIVAHLGREINGGVWMDELEGAGVGIRTEMRKGG